MTNQTNATIIRLADAAALAAEAARRFIDLAGATIAARGRFSVALSGGSTPQAMYELLARPPLAETVLWDHVHIFWGDERYVAPDDAESSFRMAREALLAHVPIPAANIYPFPTVGGTPETAASSYTATLSEFFGDAPPHLDLVLLGMGPDGHTASIFPGSPEATTPSDALVVPVYNAPKPPPIRLTFTYALINAADNILFLVAGADKSAALHDVLRGPMDRQRLPAQGVHPANGALIWLIDEAAAGTL